MKKVVAIQGNAHGHWVGDGFPVRTLFSYQTHAQLLSPFLMLDHAGPQAFAPAQTPRGVGEHPHRGFETVTIVYQGEVSHRDSTGQGGTIGPGDVQWMTAGAGILHQEFHSEAFTRQGGTLEMLQLWVNLPARDKMTAPRYQAIGDAQIPAIPLAQSGQEGQAAGQVRVIAGSFQGQQGPAQTFSPMQVWDLALPAGSLHELPAAQGWNTALVVRRGTVRINGEYSAHEGQLVVLSAQGSAVALEAQSDASVVLLSGEPLNEPVVGYGPFVMNSQEEIEQAITDFRRGDFGQIAA